MNIAEIAKLEEVTTRQIQRYCRAPGYKGHVLKATKVGRGFVVQIEDYKAWRAECGFDFLPQPDGAKSAPTTAAPTTTTAAPTTTTAAPTTTTAAPTTAPEAKCPDCATVVRSYPPWPLPANPGGPITNVPHPSSGSMPHPLAVADHQREENRKMLAKLRGYDDEA
jgi:hypothetical protein